MNASPIMIFKHLLRGAVVRRLQELKPALERAVLLGEPADDLREEYRNLLAVERTISWPQDGCSDAEAIAALAPQWPAGFPALPLWFTDPAAAAAADPPSPT